MEFVITSVFFILQMNVTLIHSRKSSPSSSYPLSAGRPFLTHGKNSLQQQCDFIHLNNNNLICLPVCLHKDRPGGVGTCDVHENGGSEESGDGVRTEGLHRSRDLPDAGRGSHLQRPSERHAHTHTLENFFYQCVHTVLFTVLTSVFRS